VARDRIRSSLTARCKLLISREDIFPNYTREGFESAFQQRFKITEAVNVRESERVLYLLECLPRSSK
jgi:hypothetical protein